MFVVYTGPHAAVDVPSAGLVDVERGKSTEVPDDVGAGLVQQEYWDKAAAPKSVKEAGDGGKAGE